MQYTIINKNNQQINYTRNIQSISIAPQNIRTNNIVKGRNIAVSEVSTPPPIVQPSVKQMKWGEPTWFLFHTLAHKVKDEAFSKIRMELLNIISLICINLPCPTCAEHASQYIKSIPFYSIQSKQGLKDMLYKFHNEINKKKGFKQFLHDDLDVKYDAANTIKIIQYFTIFFADKSHSIRMISNDMYRERILNNLKIWFSTNIQYFNN